MTLNLSTLLVHVPATGDASAHAGSSGASSAPSADGAAFQSALEAHIDAVRTAAALAGNSGSTATNAPATADAPDALEAAALKQLQTLIANGSSVQDATTALAGALATSVGSQLGATSGAAQATLSTLFAQALSPPGTSPPALTADSARTLARRFRDIANDAAGATTADAGQQNRLLGNLLDALTAKETPAPATTANQPRSGIDPATIVPARIVSTVVPIANDPSPASLAPQSQVPAGSQLALETVQAWRNGEAALSGDTGGPVVSSPGLAKAGTGGDTLLGRMLTRAAVAANANGSSSQASAPAAASSTPSSTQSAISNQATPNQATPPTQSTTPNLGPLPTQPTPPLPQAQLAAGPSTLASASAAPSQAQPAASPVSAPAVGDVPIPEALAAFIAPAETASTGTAPAQTTTGRGTEISDKIDAALGVAAARSAQAAVSQANAGGGAQTGTAQTALADAALAQVVPTASAPSPDAALAAFVDAFKRAGDASQDPADPSSQPASSTNQTQAFLASIGASTDSAAAPQHVILDGQAYTNATPTPSDPYNVVDQMVKGVFLRNLGPQQSEVRLRLVPESLGDVSVKLVVDGNSVSAQVIAQTADARNALMANHAELIRSLADAGLKLQHFSVDVSSNGNNGNFAQPQQQQVPQRSLAGSPLSSSDEETEQEESQRLLAMPTYAPPVSGSATAGQVYALA